ncbi:MAG: matrixin family metalloprotease [Pseudomonadota bacterium]
MRRRIGVILVVALVLGWGEEARAGKKIVPGEFTLGIQPLGAFQDAHAEIIRTALRDVYGFDVKAFEPQAMPKVAYYKPRKRHRADKLLVVLGQIASAQDTRCDVIVGLTGQDISTTKGKHDDWGIFGLGEIWGRACVVSSHRLTKKLGKQDYKKGLVRVVKVAIHEVGHVLGLHHCGTPNCVMHDAEGTVKTVDAETGHFCDECKAFLKGRFAYPDDYAFDVPWDKWLP